MYIETVRPQGRSSEAHKHLHGVRAGRVGEIRGGVERFGHAHRPAAKQVEGAIVGNPEQPRAKQGCLLEVMQRYESPRECILHDILTVDDRSHEACAIAMKLRS